MVGDFFGGVATEPIILPGAIVNQAILFEPSLMQPGLLDYYRVVAPTGVGTFETAPEVLLGTGATSVTPTVEPPQLLSEFDGTQFTGDPADLLGVTDPGPFLALDSGTTGDVDLLAPEPMGTLIGETIYNVHDALLVFVPTPGSGGTVGRQKIVENNSVFPRDRVFLNYSAFSNVPLSETGENVHRFVPGFEMAFFQEQMSVEVRLPFAATLDSDIRAGGFTSRNVTEFGNIVTTLKGLVYRRQQSAVTVGVSTTFPTASDVTVTGFDGQQVLSLENTSVHVLPFIGAAHSEGRWFSQGFVQGDIDTSGNRVEVLNNETGLLQEVGELHDAAFLYVGASLGYWLYQNGSAQTTFSREGRRVIKRTVHAHDHWITGFAPLAEVQFNRSVEKSESVDTGNIRIRTFDQFSLTNLVLGGLMTFGNGGSLTVAWVTPVIGKDDQQFDDEIRVALDWSL